MKEVTKYVSNRSGEFPTAALAELDDRIYEVKKALFRVCDEDPALSLVAAKYDLEPLAVAVLAWIEHGFVFPGGAGK